MRLFIALDLPEDLALPDPPGEPWRAVARTKRHITLVFLGDRRRPEVDMATLARRAPVPSAPLTVTGITTLPKRRPRVLALTLSDPTGRHTALQRRLIADLAVADDRPWLPHITIGRTRRGRVRTSHPSPPCATFTPPSMTLYESRGGAYLPLVRIPAQN